MMENDDTCLVVLEASVEEQTAKNRVWMSLCDAQEILQKVKELRSKNKDLEELLRHFRHVTDKRSAPDPNGGIAAQMNWWKDRCDELNENVQDYEILLTKVEGNGRGIHVFDGERTVHFARHTTKLDGKFGAWYFVYQKEDSSWMESETYETMLDAWKGHLKSLPNSEPPTR